MIQSRSRARNFFVRYVNLPEQKICDVCDEHDGVDDGDVDGELQWGQ